MILPFNTETLMWLLPIVFMLHDFEEIIMMKPWLNANWSELEKRFPTRIIQAMAKQKALSSQAFVVAVAEEFIVLAVFTLISVELGMVEFWAGLLLGFFIHLLIHIGQFIVFRSYVPVILTSVPAAIYSLVALHDLNFAHPLSWDLVALWTVFFLSFIVVNMIVALRLARKFDGWLRKNYLFHE
jgi:hypothetical protein